MVTSLATKKYMILYRYKIDPMITKFYINYMYVLAAVVPEITISDKYKPVETIKLHFLQSSPSVQLYTFASDCKFGLGNISGRNFVKAFSALSPHSQLCH